MYTLPETLVLEIINLGKKEGRVRYSALPKSEVNDWLKRTQLVRQAVSNYELSRTRVVDDVGQKKDETYQSICIARCESCLESSCPLYSRRSFKGSAQQIGVCLEYKLDFPDAPFDNRCTPSLRGIDSLDWVKSLNVIESFEKQGAKKICLGCYEAYQIIPLEFRDIDEGALQFEICSFCGSDQFQNIGEFLSQKSQSLGL